jgi:F0F1-type ATP synthase assembly protein I
MPFNRPTPNRKPQSKISEGLGAYVQAEKMVQIALVLPCAVLIGWGGGAWLDIRLHQSWITLVGIVVGSVAGMVSAIRLAMAAAAGPKVENKTGNGTETGSSGKEP